MTSMQIHTYYGKFPDEWYKSFMVLVWVAAQFHTEKAIARACACTVRTLRTWTQPVKQPRRQRGVPYKKKKQPMPRGGNRRADVIRELGRLISKTGGPLDV